MRYFIKLPVLLLLFFACRTLVSAQQTPINETSNNEQEGQPTTTTLYPEYVVEPLNTVIARDVQFLPFVYNGYIYVFSLNRVLPLWRLFIGGDLIKPFTISGKYIFAYDIYNRLYAVDIRRGTKVWEKDINDEIVGSPVVYGKYLLIPTRNGKIITLLMSDGSVIYKYTTKWEIGAGLLVYNNMVIVPFKNGKVIAYDIMHSVSLWEFTAGGMVTVSPLADRDRLYVGDWSDNFYALDIVTGKLLWVSYVGATISRRFLLFKDEIILFLSHGEVLCLNRKDGKIAWVKYFKDIDFDFNYFSGKNKFFIFNPEVIAFDPKKGSLIFAYRKRAFFLYKEMLFDNMVEGKRLLTERERERLISDVYFSVENYPILPPISYGRYTYFVAENHDFYVYDTERDFFIIKYKLD